MSTTNTPILSKEQLLSALNWRYAVKKFDASKKIPADTWKALEQTLVLTPSSFGLQPWKFFVVTDPAVKAKLSEASYRQTQPAESSHLVVFTMHKDLGMDHVDKYVDRISKVRGVTQESLAGFRQVMQSSIESQAKANVLNIAQSQQVFIALGQFMTAAALLGIDTCALGGIEREKYDEILGLKEKGYTTLVVCAAGYRAADDKYATLPKVRFSEEEVLAHV